MFTQHRLVYLWCALVGAALAISILPPNNWIYRFIAPYESNRWVDFLSYTLIVAIPVAAWTRRRDMLFSLVPIIVGVVFEFLQAHSPEPLVRTQDISADSFGIAAGILLGLNIRVMLSSKRPFSKVSSDPSASPTS